MLPDELDLLLPDDELDFLPADEDDDDDEDDFVLLFLEFFLLTLLPELLCPPEAEGFLEAPVVESLLLSVEDLLLSEEDFFFLPFELPDELSELLLLFFEPDFFSELLSVLLFVFFLEDFSELLSEAVSELSPL